MLALAVFFAGIVILIAGLEMAMPAYLRPDNLFSVTVAPDTRQQPDARAIIAHWRVTVGSLGVIVAAAMIVAPLLWQEASVYALTGLLFVYIFAQTGVFVLFHRQAQAFALPEGGAGAVRSSSLRARTYRQLIPYWWEIAPVAIITLTAIVLVLRYPAAPAVIPIHWDINGQANGFADKSIGAYFLSVWTQIILWVMFTALGASLTVMRIASSTGQAGESYRRLMACFLYLVKIAVLALLGIVAILTNNLAQQNAQSAEIIAGLAFAFDAAIIVLAIVLFFRVGQSGWRQARGAQQTSTTVGDMTPDSAWRGGLFYYNPDDPAVFVEKRAGIGFTLNFGNPAIWLTMLGIVALPIIIVIIAALTTHH